MRIIIAPDKFKGSCSAPAAARAIERGWCSVFADGQTALLPIADGGDGTLDAMQAACGGELVYHNVRGPLGDTVRAAYLLLADGSAVIEMAQASGLTLIDGTRRDVLRADTYGTGELMAHALQAGCRKLILGIGGSATNDGGLGMLRALGARFYSRDGEPVELPGELTRVSTMDTSALDACLAGVAVVAACDVQSPLTGPTGASVVFGPQKGATPDQVAHMDAALAAFARAAAMHRGFDHAGSPGAGAAGGLGWALMQFCGARMQPGADVVLDAAGFDALCAGADLIITGEGSYDEQSAQGKVPFAVAQRARRAGVPVVVLAGRVQRGVDVPGIELAMAIADGPMTLEQSIGQCEALLQNAARMLAQAMRLGMRP